MEEASAARVILARAALASIAGQGGPEAENVRYRFSLKLRSSRQRPDRDPVERLRDLGLTVVEAERIALERLLSQDKINPPTYMDLQEQLDWNELAVLRDADRRIEEI